MDFEEAKRLYPPRAEIERLGQIRAALDGGEA